MHFHFPLHWLYCMLFEMSLCGCLQFHSMWIYYLRFFFQVECLPSHFRGPLPVDFAEILLVPSTQILGVGVPNELICAPSPPGSLVAPNGIGEKFETDCIDIVLGGLVFLLTLAFPQ